MAIEITPEPSEAERRAILAALPAADGRPPAETSRWRASALDDLFDGLESLRDGALAEQSRGDAGVVEP